MKRVLDMESIRDKLWLWGHESGSHDGRFGLPGGSRITPAGGAEYLGVPNLIMVAFGGRPEPPLDAYAQALSPLKRVVWSIIGDGSSTRNDERTDLDDVIRLAEKYPNIAGAIMDDFFRDESSGKDSAGRYTPDDVQHFARSLHGAPRSLDLWVVLYAHQLGLPFAGHLERCDGVTFWTWRAEDLSKLESNFERLESIAPNSRKMLGCYMWDYGAAKPMPVKEMAMQCEIGLRWLREGRVEGIVFLASCICDLNLEAVEWTRNWIARLDEGST
jgi:hypothetical protein